MVRRYLPSCDFFVIITVAYVVFDGQAFIERGQVVRKTRLDPKLSVGLDIIDNQHEMLFDLIKDIKTSYTSEVNMRVQDTLHGVLLNTMPLNTSISKKNILKIIPNITGTAWNIIR
jgi:hypothetical protein